LVERLQKRGGFLIELLKEKFNMNKNTKQLLKKEIERLINIKKDEIKKLKKKLERLK